MDGVTIERRQEHLQLFVVQVAGATYDQLHSAAVWAYSAQDALDVVRETYELDYPLRAKLPGAWMDFPAMNSVTVTLVEPARGAVIGHSQAG